MMLQLLSLVTMAMRWENDLDRLFSSTSPSAPELDRELMPGDAVRDNTDLVINALKTMMRNAT